MKRAIDRALVLPLLCLTAVSSSSCSLGGSSPESRFYLLTAVEDPAPVSAEGVDVAVRIDAVELPKHLDGPEITSRVGGNELKRSEYERWGEPLGDNFGRVLAANLSNMLQSDRVLRFPWEGPGPVDYHVTVAVIRFDSEAGKAILEARWNIAGPDVRDLLATKRSRFEHPVEGERPADIARAMSTALGDLSRELAVGIRQQAQSGN